MVEHETIGGWFRFITPVLVTITLFLVTQLWSEVRLVTERVYHHQTNAELHVTRAEMVELKRDLQEMRREIIVAIRQSGSSAQGASGG